MPIVLGLEPSMHVWCMSSGYTLKLTQVEFFVKSAGSLGSDLSSQAETKMTTVLAFFKVLKFQKMMNFFT